MYENLVDTYRDNTCATRHQWPLWQILFSQVPVVPSISTPMHPLFQSDGIPRVKKNIRDDSDEFYYAIDSNLETRITIFFLLALTPIAKRRYEVFVFYKNVTQLHLTLYLFIISYRISHIRSTTKHYKGKSDEIRFGKFDDTKYQKYATTFAIVRSSCDSPYSVGDLVFHKQNHVKYDDVVTPISSQP